MGNWKDRVKVELEPVTVFTVSMLAALVGLFTYLQAEQNDKNELETKKTINTIDEIEKNGGKLTLQFSKEQLSALKEELLQNENPGNRSLEYLVKKILAKTAQTPLPETSELTR